MYATFIGPTDTRWREVLNRARYDFYHLPEYLEFCGKYEDGEPIAFYAEDGHSACLIPFMLKRMPQFLGTPTSWCDLISPYGYPCPLFTHPVHANRVLAFLAALLETAGEIDACSVLVRLHPLLDTSRDIALPLTALVRHGETVSIDLTKSEDDIWLQTRTGHCSDIRRLEKLKFVSVMDDWTLYKEFGRMYQETMVRIGAAALYRFSHDYFRDLKRALGERLHLCCVLSADGRPAGGGLFTTVDDIIQYHLSGTDAMYHRLAPTKLMLHSMRIWGKQHGYSVLHLGGGAGAQRDALFEFKAGFSPNRHGFGTLRMVVNESRYAALMLRVGRTLNLQGDLKSPYFPPYRRVSDE